MDQKDIEKSEYTKHNTEAGNESKTSESEPYIRSIKESIRINSETLKGKVLLDSEGNFIPEVLDCLINVYESYCAIQHLPHSELFELNKLLGNMLIECNLLDVCCQVIIHIYPLNWLDKTENAIRSKYDALIISLGIIGDISDDSDELAVTAAKRPNFLETVRNILTDYLEDHLKSTLIRKREDVLEACLTIVHNLSMRDSNISRLRALKVTEDLKPYLNSPRDDYRLLALASLAAIVNEKESEIINANQDQVKLLFEILQKGLGKEKRRHDGWSCKEIALIIRNLSNNDANKCLLVKLGALELLVELGITGDPAERYESVQAIWTLSFDKKNQKKIANSHDLGVVELLLDLKGSGDDKIKKACDGAFWNLEKYLKTSSVQKYKLIAEETDALHQGHKSREKDEDKSSEESLEDEGHVMISYQWDDQEMLLKVRDSLEASGFKVWMDIDQMSGSTLQAMAEAVENASIVLVSMSRKYKNSSSCRSEAEYAYQKQKKIIPLKLEHDYRPDGWLGIITGTKLYFEFTYKYPFEQKLKDLVREIQRQRGNNEEEIKPEIASPVYKPGPTAFDEDEHTPAHHSAAMARTPNPKEMLLKVRKWNQTEVQTWIRTNDLESSTVRIWTGSEVALLLKMSTEAPEFFYRFLHDNLMVSDLQTMSKFVWALNDLKDGI